MRTIEELLLLPVGKPTTDREDIMLKRFERGMVAARKIVPLTLVSNEDLTKVVIAVSKEDGGELKTESIILGGLNSINGKIQEGGKFGLVESDLSAPLIKITLDKKCKDDTIVIHPTLGKIPHYKAAIHDACIKAAQILIKSMEK